MIYLTFPNTVSQATFDYLFLTVQHWDLQDAMPRQSSPTLPTHPFTQVLRIWEIVFYSQAFFTLHSPLLLSRLPWGRQFNLKGSRASRRHFSHVAKSRIFKNLNLRKKADYNFPRTFLKNRFRHLKLYSNPPSWLARDRCHIGTFWKTKGWSSHF